MTDGEHDLPMGTIIVEQQPSGPVSKVRKNWLLGLVTEDGLMWVQERRWHPNSRPKAGDKDYAMRWSQQDFPEFREAVSFLLQQKFTFEKDVIQHV